VKPLRITLMEIHPTARCGVPRVKSKRHAIGLRVRPQR
jgi:hypothetical protein